MEGCNCGCVNACLIRIANCISIVCNEWKMDCWDNGVCFISCWHDEYILDDCTINSCWYCWSISLKEGYCKSDVGAIRRRSENSNEDIEKIWSCEKVEKIEEWK